MSAATSSRQSVIKQMRSQSGRVFLVQRRKAYEYVAHEKLEQGEALLTELSTDDQFSANDWVNLSLVRFQMKKWLLCEKAAEKALELDPDNMKAVHCL